MFNELHEECGVFGVYSRDGLDVASLCYYGLYALQHRGQESCGIAINDDGVIHCHKGAGLVSDIFTPEALRTEFLPNCKCSSNGMKDEQKQMFTSHLGIIIQVKLTIGD